MHSQTHCEQSTCPKSFQVKKYKLVSLQLKPTSKRSPFPQSLPQYPYLVWMHKPPETHASECWGNPDMLSTHSHSFGPRNWVNSESYCKPFKKLSNSFECTLLTAHILNPSWSVLGEKHRQNQVRFFCSTTSWCSENSVQPHCTLGPFWASSPEEDGCRRSHVGKRVLSKVFTTENSKELFWGKHIEAISQLAAEI